MLSSGNTGALANHECAKERERYSSVDLTKDDREMFENSLVALCAGQLLPPNLIMSEDFAVMIQAALDLGAKYSKLNAKDIIPYRTTLTVKMKAMADRAQADLVSSISEYVEDELVSSTADAWTDSQRGRKFLAQTVSYVDEEFCYNENLLGVPHCDAESATAPVILEEIKSNLAKINLDPNSKLHYVTDDGSDIVCALKQEERTYCADHCTNLLVKKALTLQLSKLNLYGPEGEIILEKIAAAVSAIKSSRLNSASLANIKGKLKPFPKNRGHQIVFRSCIPMLQIVHNNYASVSTV
ncbi:Transposable element Hobo transposase [Frankliniella fusca]|uniref:Transposable element Hobo transposase n=1 Tax=Frankliniella fusca TaxID=407009 RepID=A0AAE1HRB7_9NEOP|nr:Transposable element Hobo transposase [Frankliniella fusca]